MFSLIFIIKRLIALLSINKQLWREDEEFRVLVIVMVTILVSGTAFYSIVEKWNILDSIYFCVMTIATIGYGDFAPSTTISKIFTIIIALSGIGVFVGIVTKLAQGLTKKGIDKKHRNRHDAN